MNEHNCCSLSNVEKILQWQQENKILFKKTDPQSDKTNIPATITPIPISLTAATFPHAIYNLACQIQPSLNKMIRNIVQERTLLSLICNELQGDAFTKNLYDIWKEDWNSKRKVEIRLNLLRSDYLLHENLSSSLTDRLQAKQVEINTVAASFAHLSSRLCQMPTFTCPNVDCSLQQKLVEKHEADRKTCDAFLKALDLFDSTYNTGSMAVMLVSSKESNVYDQQGIIDLMNGRMIKLTFSEINQQHTLRDQHLLINGKHIGLIYYRTGYDPRDCNNDAWMIRRIIELSSVIKVPDIGSHLAGSKTVQQELTRTGVLEKFVPKDIAQTIRSTFVQMYQLAGAIDFIKTAPDNWVVKPNREGGGHNVYGSDIVPFLETLTPNDYKEYIVMERIRSPAQEANLLKNGIITKAKVIPELGIYGIHLSLNNQDLINEQVGYLVRSKESHVNEGGVVSGFAYLSNLTIE